MKCYYTLFTKKGLAANIGSYILFFNILAFMISGIFFYKCGFHFLEEDISVIISSKEEKYKKEKENEINRKETMEEKVIKLKKIKKTKIKTKKKKITIKKSKNKNKNELNLNDATGSVGGGNVNSKSVISLKIQNKVDIISKNNNIDLDIDKDKNSILDKEFIYLDYELNTMPYKEALTYDKRTFCGYYLSLIKTKNYILFSFFPAKDYNSTIVKVSLFLLFFSVFYFINALFFDEPTIHKIYEDEGLYNFIFLVPHIFYSFVISYTLNTIIKYIFLSERNICKIKEATSLNESYEIKSKVRRRLILKYICYFGAGTIFLFFFWYYLSSFGAVYQNTQTYLIKNTLISFTVSLVYPFIINIFGILRTIALKERNNECLYKLSIFINFI